MPAALVQELDQVGFSNFGHTALVLTVPAGGVAAGHSILVAIEVTINTGTITVSDDAGNEYALDLLYADGHRLLIYSAHQVIPLEAGDEITVSFDQIFFASEVLFSSAVALEYTGLVSADQLDQTADQSGSDTALSSGVTGATDRAHELAVAFFATDGGPGEFTPGAGWTARAGASSYTFGVGGHTLYPVDQILSSAGTQEATGTLSQSRGYLAGIVTYRSTGMADPVGNLGHVAIGIEATPGTGVDAQVYLDAVSETLKGEGGPIRSKALTGGRMTKKAVMGPYDFGGDLVYEVTPDKCTKLLLAALGSLTAAPETAAPYTHVFKTGSSLKAITTHIYRPGPDGNSEPCYFVYPGGYVETLEFSQNAEEILTATASLKGRGEEIVYDAAQADGGIAYSALDPFVFHELVVSIGGSPVAITNNWRFRIATGLIVRRNLSGGRAANRAFAGDSLISGSFELVFEDITQHRLWLGDSADSSPVNVGTTVNTQVLQLAWTKGTASLTLKCGKAYFRTSGPAIQGRDQLIIQPVEWEALYNASDASDLVATVVNAETNANIATAGTTISP